MIADRDDLYSSVQVAKESSVNLMRKAGKDHAYIQTFLADFMASYTVLAQEQEDLLTAAGLRLVPEKIEAGHFAFIEYCLNG